MNNDVKNSIEKNKNKKIITQLIITILFICVVLGTSLALFFIRRSGSLNQITTRQLVDVTYSDGSTLRLTSNTPLYESQVEKHATEFNFTINNPNTIGVYASINLDDIILSENLKIYDFKWALYEGNIKLTMGNFSNVDTNLNLYNNSFIDANSNKSYKIKLWVNETGEIQDLQGTSFTSKVSVTGYSKKVRTLNSKILSDNTLNTTVNFESTATDNGLFVQKDDMTKTNMGFPTYYYRGTVDNNYVKFGTYKKPVTNKVIIDGTEIDTVVANIAENILWRIVRINEDGTIKLISQNNIGDTYHAWDQDSLDYSISDIKTTLETWYNTNIKVDTNIDNKIIANNYCNDMAFDRINTTTPSFVCPNGSNIVNSKVGLITADEALYSGSNLTSSISYMNNNTNFWTMSLASNSELKTYYLGYQNNIFGLYDNNISNLTSAARMVITLKANTLVTKGNGTIDNPYVISNKDL